MPLQMHAYGRPNLQPRLYNIKVQDSMFYREVNDATKILSDLDNSV